MFKIFSFFLVIFFSLTLNSEEAINTIDQISDINIGSNFKLIDQNNKEFDNTKSDKPYSLVFFGYRTCKTICPTAMHDLTAVLSKNQNPLKKIQPVFISLDPLKDTPELLKNFAKPFDKSILMLTSGEKNSEEYITKLFSQYKAYVQKIKLNAKEKVELGEDNDYIISHTSLFYLINNKTGKVVAYSPDDQKSLSDLLRKYK